MTIRLAGLSVIITGGATGLGKVLAAELAGQGANVLICGRREDRLKDTMAELGESASGELAYSVCDVRSKADVQATVAKCAEVFGAVDVVINNAGLTVPDLVEDCKEEDWDTVMETNVKGTFLMSQAALPSMKAKRSGVILNIASQAAIRGYAQVASYSASKHAILGFAEALEKEVQEFGIRVHSLCPGLIQLPPPKHKEELNPKILQVGDVVAAALYVLSQPPHVKINNIGLYNRFDPDV